MFHKVSLEVAPPDAHGIVAINGGTGLPHDDSSVLTLPSSSSPPIMQMQTEPLSPPCQSVQPASFSHNNSILVIDDSPTVRKILETCLERAGFQVTSFEDGVAAIRWLSQSGATLPALIILDVNLPKMSGYEVARFLKMKSALKNTIFIMLTRRDGVIERVKGHLSGAQEYLCKPFTTQTIIAVVELYLGVPSRL